MNTELDTIFSKFKENIKKYKIIENIIIFTSIISANFVAYIAYFDINIFMFIDSSALITHTFSMIILFTFISAFLTIFLLLIQNIMLFKSSYIADIPIITIKDPNSSKIYKLLSNKLLKYIITVMIFSFLYIGGTNTSYVLAVFFMVFSFVYMIDLFKEYYTPVHTEDEIFNKEYYTPVHTEDEIFNKIKFYNKLPSSFKEILKIVHKGGCILKKDLSNLYKDDKSFQIILSRLGIMLITLSLLIGVGKANFIEKNNLVSITSHDKNISNYSLFLTTKNGIFTFNQTNKSVEFLPWGYIKKITFLSENPYSLHRLIPQNNKNQETR